MDKIDGVLHNYARQISMYVLTECNNTTYTHTHTHSQMIAIEMGREEFMYRGKFSLFFIVPSD